MRYVYKDCATNLIGTYPQIFCLQFQFAYLHQGREMLRIPHRRLRVISLRGVMLTWLGTPVYVLIINPHSYEWGLFVPVY